MKYNDKLVIRENDSHSIILRQINANSTVLEFGSAFGAMTQYMKEELCCNVYIVEYVKDAFDKAIQYAVDGVCGDITDYEWLTKFKTRFDYIIFADVLEHLKQPEQVLKRAKSLLKENGEVFVSIPNIAHSDVIMKLIDNHFDYTDVGLLDDTHVHFWGAKNILEFVGNCGFTIKQMNYVRIPFLQTEQFRGGNCSISKCIKNYLLSRNNSDVYQYVMTLIPSEQEKNSDWCDGTLIYSNNAIQTKIYLDTGTGFGENEVIFAPAEVVGECKFYVEIELDGAKRLRVDPVEGQGCIVDELVVSQNGKVCKVKAVNAIEINNRFLLLGDDPQIVIDGVREEEKINLKYSFYLEGEYFYEVLLQEIQSRVEGVKKKDKEIEEYKKICEKYNQMLLNDSFISKYINNNMLSEKDTDFYQYVRSFMTDVNNVLQTKIYLDTGKGFNENEVIFVPAKAIEKCKFYVEIELDNVKRLRVDPVEGQGCIVDEIVALQNGAECNVVFDDAIEINNQFLLANDDPQIVIDGVREEEKINLKYSFYLEGEYFYKMLLMKVKSRVKADVEKI